MSLDFIKNVVTKIKDELPAFKTHIKGIKDGVDRLHAESPEIKAHLGEIKSALAQLHEVLSDILVEAKKANGTPPSPSLPLDNAPQG